MRRLNRHCPDLPLFDVAHTRRIEAAALAPLPAHALMQRAGAAVARLALALAPHARLIRIVTGTGNNGGDGIDAAIRLQHAGKAVEVILLGEPQADDARDALARAHDAGVPVHAAATSALREQHRKDRKARAVPVHDWWQGARQRLARREFHPLLAEMYGSSMAMSPAFADEFRAFWALPATWTPEVK